MAVRGQFSEEKKSLSAREIKKNLDPMILQLSYIFSLLAKLLGLMTYPIEQASTFHE